MPKAGFWDEDIAKLALAEAEKDGLQVYRNYSRAFEDHAEKRFAEQVNAEEYDPADLRQVLSLIVSDDPRFLPVIGCAFIDGQLREMFSKVIPSSLPGDRSNLLGPFGPLGDLFKRIQLAHIFGMLSPDLAVDLDHLRQTRNQLAHNWNMTKLTDFYTRGKIAEIFPVDTLLLERLDLFPQLSSELEPIQTFRIRVIWMTARLSYEAPLFARSRESRLIPQKALYGPNHPARLALISELAMNACRDILRAPQ